MEYIEFKGKNVDEAISAAVSNFGVDRDDLEIEIVEREKAGLLGIIGSKQAVIKARKKPTIADTTKDFLEELLKKMDIEATVTVSFDEAERVMDIDVTGEDMGILIGKRGQTLDSLQYLISSVVNKNKTEYIRVKLDTENYRARRKDTLENLAKNIAYKVKRYRKSISLEPMNPYERRIIHSALQDDKYVSTRSEGEEPMRHVIVYLKRNSERDK